MTGCKIGKVKMKNGGAPIFLISSQKHKMTDAEVLLQEAIQMVRSGHIHEVGIIAAVEGEKITSSYSEGMKSYVYDGVAACEILKNRLLETLKHDS